MNHKNHKTTSKYHCRNKIKLDNRQWPLQQITKAPVWASVDLRDGNQALARPMDIKTKTVFFNKLAETGFRQIEVGFPSASRQEYNFVRQLIEKNMIPDNVTVQVLVPTRHDLIRKTVAALKGVKKAIIHMYISTSPVQRRQVLGRDKKEIKKTAAEAVRYARNLTSKIKGTDIRLEFSPESFSTTEPDYAMDICRAAVKAWQPAAADKVIINLPATMEVFTPNVYADYIEYFHRFFPQRNQVILSVHTHNDRGCAVAASEMALLAGAERVEGTLFGNGERSGNADIVTLALNMASEGRDPELKLDNIPALRALYEQATGQKVPARHPYAGDMIYTAYAGTHQDAIRKGLHAYRKQPHKGWDIPYLPLDPADIGRSYTNLIRINAQSGKGGTAYIAEKILGRQLNKTEQQKLYTRVQNECEKHRGVISASRLRHLCRQLPAGE
ncbi:MAG TPA: 2-isopropylmalate synthase [Spirochaetota bacterium]|nr:2-isopropylmalate synthase [Spirochaetota bacterium]